MKTKKLKTLPKEAILLGRVILTWSRSERISDRYGSVWLMRDGYDSSSQEADPAETRYDVVPDNQQGCLIAHVTEARQSSHIGDFARGLSPQTPVVGDIIVLGEGQFFTEDHDDFTTVGVRPLKERDSDWLNPRALYDVHESLVELIWSPKRLTKPKLAPKTKP